MSGLGFEPSGDDAAKEEEADHERTHDARARPSSSRIPRNANTAMFGTRDRHLPTLAAHAQACAHTLATHYSLPFQRKTTGTKGPSHTSEVAPFLSNRRAAKVACCFECQEAVELVPFSCAQFGSCTTQTEVTVDSGTS